LGLLEGSSRHGYDLKRSYDRRFGEVKPIRFGQVYRTLSQLERDGLVEVADLERASGHGYAVKCCYDRRLGEVKPIRFGQVYRTLSQLERDGLVEVAGVEAGAGPDRKRYAITPEGVTDLDTWLGEPEEPQPHRQSVLFTKVVVALLSGRSAKHFLDVQRARHLDTMKALTTA